MKSTILNILTILVLLAAVALAIGLITIFVDPYSALNPLPPPTVPATIELPSVTPTLPPLPATWTPESSGTSFPTLRNSATPLPTNTTFVASTFTVTLTITG
ncbi:MAG: hypothetical protein HPY76_01775, partial [Anaerolineae bacterium]|nr:hypothetical protein [Anaerolineae bacterium]